MILLRWLFERKMATPSVTMDGVPVRSAGVSVTPGTVNGHSTVWACINLISSSLSTMPLRVYRMVDGIMVEDARHPLNRVLASPNFDQTPVDFWDGVIRSLELRGSGLAEIERSGANGRPAVLKPIPFDRCRITRERDGRIGYRWSDEFGKTRQLFDNEVLHIRGPGGDPLGGMSTISHARRIFGIALAADRAAAGTFENGMRPSGVLKNTEFLNDEQRKLVDEHILPQLTGPDNAGRPLKLEGGFDFVPISLSPLDAQLLESRKWSVQEIARWFGVPPEFVGESSGASGVRSSFAEMTLNLMKFTLRPRFVRIEQSLEKHLLSAADKASGVKIRFDFDDLLRVDSKARAEVLQILVRSGVMAINEARRLLNLPPVDGGDQPRVQSQNILLTEATDGNA